ncbi:MAG: hypothetical protein H7Z21_14255 [Hymenobacter sp.]|nr:hypothetical protein [Hymenobacter sp.]
MNAHSRLLLIKSIHTIIWGFFVIAIGCVVYSRVVDRITVYTWVASGLVIGEGMVLVSLKNRCPLTLMARKYSASPADNFDIFLPNWLARYKKLIFTAIYLVGMLLVGSRLVR